MRLSTLWPDRGRGTLLASLGAGLEYYDFVTYALLAPFLRTAFFPAVSRHVSLLETLGLFAVGYVARPLGGLVFGSRGDRHGRKATFLHTTVLMAVATFLIGCLPVYNQVGLWAPAALMVLRCVQGFSFGGELPGAITFVAEHSGNAQRGRGCAAVMSSVTVGSLVAAFMLQMLSAHLGDDAMATWGWRLPFLLGGSLAAVTFVARRKLRESPEFVVRPRSPLAPLGTLLQHHPGALITGLCVALLGATLVIFPLYAPLYLQTWFAYAMADVYSATTVSLLWAAVGTVIAGVLTDSFGPRRTLTGCALVWGCAVPAVFTLLQQGSLPGLYLFCLAWQTATAGVVGCYLTVLAELFPAEVRHSGIALCYNVAFTLAALLPSVFSQMTARWQQPLLLAWVYVGFAALAVAALVLQFRRKAMDNGSQLPVCEGSTSNGVLPFQSGT